MKKAEQVLKDLSDINSRTDMAITTQNLARRISDKGTAAFTCKICGVSVADNQSDMCDACAEKGC